MEERYESELAHSERVLDDVDRALERLSDGSLRACEVCGAAIAEADLAADPTRRLCVRNSAALAVPSRAATSDQLTTFHRAAKKSAFTFLYCR